MITVLKRGSRIRPKAVERFELGACLMEGGSGRWGRNIGSEVVGMRSVFSRGGGRWKHALGA